MTTLISHIVPEAIKNSIRKYKDRKGLKALQKVVVDTSNLVRINDGSFLESIFKSADFKKNWEKISAEVGQLMLPENTGGVNEGDQRAIAYLVWHFKPVKILEIGTHIGCSTVHLSIAQRELL
ncbi:hypothetical protein CLV53_1291 [Sediminibacterium magnilacihabitans]|nr:hypothetical protein CLV53_1291 [Sediminibacterium magnilacihabitans]